MIVVEDEADEKEIVVEEETDAESNSSFSSSMSHRRPFERVLPILHCCGHWRPMSRPFHRREAERDACGLWLSMPIDGMSIEQEINSNDEKRERTIEWPLQELRRIFGGKEWSRQFSGNHLDSILKCLRLSKIGLDCTSEEEKRIDLSKSESTNGEFQSRRDEIY